MHVFSTKRRSRQVTAISFALLALTAAAWLPLVASAARRPAPPHSGPAPQTRSCNSINMQYGRTVTGLTITSHIETPTCSTASLVARSYVVKAKLPTATDVSAGPYACQGTRSAAQTWSVVCTLGGRTAAITVDFQEHDTAA